MTSFKRILYTDTETYSSVDIKACGSFKYIESPDFNLLLLAYAWDDDEVRVLDTRDPADAEALEDVRRGLNDPQVLKISHNTDFERNVYRRVWGAYMPPSQWLDTKILAAYNGLPMSLDAAGAALQLPDQKIKEGVSLIAYFCKPCRPTKANGGRTRNLPEHDPERWQRFKAYAGRDVVTMREIYHRLKDYPVTDFERQVWETDARINERGVLVDTDLAEAALAVDRSERERNEAELKRLTGIDNPNSVTQLKGWLAGIGIEAESLDKKAVKEARKQTADPAVQRALELRQLLGKTSTKKYETMLNAICADHRVRGITQYYGAVRTGRWAGRLVQLQNLPQNHLEHIEEVRDILLARDTETLELLFDSIPDTLSQLIRTAFIAKPGHTFLVADYSAIEARVIAYLAREQWRMDVFRDGGDIYCASASQMFHVPVVKHGINGHLRQKGKISELALGYGGGVNALIAFGADKMGLSQEEMENIVSSWRRASPSIPKLWERVEEAARRAITTPGRHFTVARGADGKVCTYWTDRDALRCQLPSGRIITYWHPSIDDEGIHFMGQNQMTRQWEPIKTWGGRLVENVVQSFARDCLATAMTRLEAAGFEIVFHVHDEVIVEAMTDHTWKEVADIMGQAIDWAPGLLLRGDGYETPFYKKD